MRIVKRAVITATFSCALFTNSVRIARAQSAVIVAGSSAMWEQMGLAMAGVNPQLNCAWTQGLQIYPFMQDTRPPAPAGGGIYADAGNLWVVWTPGTGGSCSAPATNSQVYAYISVDSTIGLRCLFGSPQCKLFTGESAGVLGYNLLPGVTDTPLPANILSAIEGSSVSIAATDIPPADAKLATFLSLTPCGPISGTQYTGLGYGVDYLGFHSYYSPSRFHWLLDFNINGTDPYTGASIPAFTVTPVGASPLLVVVNTTNQNSGGFGDTRATNINRATLAGYLAGFLGRTADVIAQPFAGTNASYYGSTTLIPEPISGAYRVMEHSVPNNKELYASQESGNCNNAPFLSEPLNLTLTVGSTTSVRRRVLGQDEMIAQLSSTSNPDSIGYAFWSASAFANTSNIKYLTVDGVDPLFDTYAAGTIPQSGNNLLASVTLRHVKDGAYPLWSVLRLVNLNNNTAAFAAAQTLSSAAQNQVSFGTGATHPDFVPFAQLNVFHTHYATLVDSIQGNSAANGNGICGTSSAPEAGGDVGGLVLNGQAGADFCVLKNNYNDPKNGLGPTNTAAFGVRQ